MALGATARDVFKLIVGRGMKLTAIGVLVGIGGAAALTRLMHSLLFNTSATDPITFVLISVLLCLAAFLACYIPARRAAKVDPLVGVAVRIGCFLAEAQKNVTFDFLCVFAPLRGKCRRQARFS